MTALSIAIVKGRTADRTEIRRADGSTVQFDFSKKGPMPHDVVHLFVEEGLGLGQGFWGMVADRADPSKIQEIAKAAGHASSKRAQKPDAHIVEILQVERIVECFEADLWSAAPDTNAFREVASAACASSFVEAPPLTDAVIASIRARIAAFLAEWRAAPDGARFEFTYQPTTGR